MPMPYVVTTAGCAPSVRPTQNSYRKPRREVDGFGSCFSARGVPGGSQSPSHPYCSPACTLFPMPPLPAPVPASLPSPPKHSMAIKYTAGGNSTSSDDDGI